VKDKESVSNLVWGGVVMLAWGMSDSQIQALAYWQIGIFYSEGVKQSRAVGFFKLVRMVHIA
jgi:hypothetical protein